MRTLTAGQQCKSQISHAPIGFIFSKPIVVLGGNRRQLYASALCWGPWGTESRWIAKFVAAQRKSCRHPFGFVPQIPHRADPERMSGRPPDTRIPIGFVVRRDKPA